MDVSASADQDEVRRLQDRLRALGRATHCFAAATDDYTLLLETIAHVLSDVIGDACALFLLSNDGEELALATLQSAHADFVRDCRTVLATPMRIAARPPWQRVVLTGESLLVPEINLDMYGANSAPEYVDLLRRTGLRSSLVVALRVHGQSLGLLALSRFREGSPPYDERDRELAQMIADHAALAIGSARSYAAERTARSAEARAAADVERMRGRAHLAAIVDGSDDAIIGKTLEGIITSWNRGAENIFGYSADEAVGRSIRLIVPPDRQSEESTILETLALGEVRRFETVRRRKDGKHIEVSVTTSPIADESGRIIGASKVARDITERRRAEEALAAARRAADEASRELELLKERAARVEVESALKQSEVRFRALVENGADGITLSTAAGTLTYASPAALRIFGRTAAEVIGTNFRAYVHPDDVAGTFDQRQRVLDEGGRTPLAVRRLVRPDGSVRWVEAITTNLLEDPAIGAMVGNFRDVTDRRHVEDALVAAQQRYTALFESGIIGILVTGGSGTVHEANDTFLTMLGYTREDVEAGRVDWRRSTPPEWEAWSAQATAELREHGRAKPREKEYFRKDGTRVPVLVGVAAMGGGQNISLSIDLSERARAAKELAALEAQFRQAQKMEAVGRLAGGVAHDFNNVLSVILSYADMFLGDLKPGDPMRLDVEEIRKAGNRAAGLTRQLLLFSRQQVFEPKVIDVNDVLAGMDKMLQRIVGEDVEIVLSARRASRRVRADATGIEQVIMNLVVNARDAMPIGGQLTIETADTVLDEAYASEHVGVQPGSYVLLAVSDTGTGMSSATQARIFEPFFTTKEMGKGTGLGLSTVFGIVQQCGGSVWVYSELGKGTTFKVYLPAIDAAVDEPQPHVAPATLRGSETILLVEDEAPVRAVARNILKRQGYHLIEAQNGGEALLHCERHTGTIDLLITDVVMPQMSGPELARRLAATRPTMKILCMSGYTDDAVVRHGALDPGIAFIQKPFTPDTLATKVREVLDGGRT